MNDNNNGLAKAIEEIGAMVTAANAVQEIGDTHHVVVPEGYKLVDLTAAIEKAGASPRRKTGTVQLSEIGSFNQFVADQGESGHVYIYADPDARTLTAVLNDHVHSHE